MDKNEIPGLNPLWVIDFKPKSSSKASLMPFEEKMAAIHTRLQDHYQKTAEALEICRNNSLKIQTEISKLNEIIAKFRSVLDKFPKPEPEPPKEFDSQ